MPGFVKSNSLIDSSFFYISAESPFLMLNSGKLCGLIALEVCEGSGEFIWAHTTNTMGIGYMSTKHKNPKVRISKLPEGKLPGTTITLEGISW